MSRKVKEKEPVRCIAYLSVFNHDRYVESYEKKQLKKIKEYAVAHNIEIVKVFHKDVLGQGDVNEHFAEIVGRINRGQADGVIVFSMRCICPFMETAYTKVGMVKSAGGRMFTCQTADYLGRFPQIISDGNTCHSLRSMRQKHILSGVTADYRGLISVQLWLD